MSFFSRNTFSLFLLLTSVLTPLSFARADAFNGYSNANGYSGPVYTNSDATILAGTYLDPTIDPNYSDVAYRWTPGGGVQALGLLSGDVIGHVNAIDGDGLTIIGYMRDLSGNTHAARWVGSNAAPEFLTEFPGASNSNTIAVSADGSVIVGEGDDGFGNGAVIRWIGNSGPQNMGSIAGSISVNAFGLSADGSTIIGASYDINGMEQAIRWVGNNPAEALGFLPGGTFSEADYVSSNGSVIAGSASDNNAFGCAVRWVGNNPIEALPMLSGDVSSSVAAISADGSVIAGFSGSHGVRWDGSNANVSELGDLPGGMGVTYIGAISGNDHVIVGGANDSNGTQVAVRWVGNNPAEKISDLLIAKGVDLTNWTLDLAITANNDGNIITGEGTENGFESNFIANFETGGLTTPQNLATSLQGNIAASQQANQTSLNSLNQSMFTAQHLGALSVPMASVPTNTSSVVKHPDGSQTMSMVDDGSSYGLLTPYQPTLASRLSVYTVGSLGLGEDNNFDNHDVNGTIGASLRFDHDITVGVGYLGSASHTDMIYGGQSNVDARGVSAVFSYLPQYGLRAFGTAYIADMDLTIDRNYLNGSGIAGSRGTPDGNSHGLAGEIGYAMPINKQMTGVPFVNTRWSKTSIDAYTETGGPFAADFSTQKDTNVTSNLGYELDYQMNQKTNLYGRASWGHRFSGDSSDFTASSSGLTETLGIDPGDRNWAEGAIGTNYQMSEKVRLSAEISGRTGVTQEPITTITVGANISF